MLLAELAALSGRVGETSRRTEKIALLASGLTAASRGERGLCALFLSGQVRQNKLGVGPSQVRSLAQVEPAKAPTLSLREVDRALDEVANARGAGSAQRRLEALRGLMARATGEEQRFLGRLLLGELRHGALESLVLEGVARAASVSLASLRRAHMLSGDLANVTETAFVQGEAGLRRFDLTLFRPVLPMLAEPAADPEQALAQLGRAAFELKLDGARVQLHKAGADVGVFSRSGQDVTGAVPELVELARGLPARELVLDGETLALRADGRPLPFQETMRRFGRKLDVQALREALPLSPFYFDCLYVDGQSLLDAPGEERFRALAERVPEAQRVRRIVSERLEEADAFYAEALSSGHEGLMAKSLIAPYFAGKRGASWLKIKPAHTLDLVVLAAEWGSGRRTGFLSNLHLGARDTAREGEFVMLGKTFKGLTDAMLAEQTAALLAREVRRDAYTVYVRPELVVEVAFSDVQTSPQYPAGLALRFARVKRYRPDKTAAEADTIDTVRAIHSHARR